MSRRSGRSRRPWTGPAWIGSSCVGKLLAAETVEAIAARQTAVVVDDQAGLGRDQAHDTVPYFFSDLADWASFEYVGPALAWDDEVIEGDMSEGEFTVWYVAGGKVVAMRATAPSSRPARTTRQSASRQPDKRSTKLEAIATRTIRVGSSS